MAWYNPKHHGEDGLTLTELLMAMAISGLLLGAMISTFITQRRIYTVQEHVAEMALNVRAALDMMSREVRMAGYGTPASHLADWIDWLHDEHDDSVALTRPVMIAPGGAAPDALTIVGCFDPPIAHIEADADAGSNKMQVRYRTTTKKLNTETKKIVYIGRHENAVVTASPDDKAQVNTITIDTDPTQAGDQGVTESYPPESTPVELLKMVTYTVVMDEKNYATPTPILKRDDHTGGHAQPLAENIEDLRLTQDGNILTIAITGRTAQPDSTYTHPVKGDGYRRLTLSARLHLRNLGR